MRIDGLEQTRPILQHSRRRRPDPLSAAILLTGAALVAIGVNSGPSEPAERITFQGAPPAEPGTTLTLRKSGESALISNLMTPNSPLLRELQERYDRDGSLISHAKDCSEDVLSSDRTFTAVATEREAPFRIAKAIREIAVGETFKSQIEIIIDSIHGKTTTDTWLGQVNGDNITWAIKEQRLREQIIKTYAVNIFPQAECRDFQLPDYTKISAQMPAGK